MPLRNAWLRIATSGCPASFDATKTEDTRKLGGADGGAADLGQRLVRAHQSA